MTGFNQASVDAHNQRIAAGKLRKQGVAASSEAVVRPNDGIETKGVDLESKLHKAVIAFCDSRWPRWKCVYARMDKKSTLPVGCQDFTVFGKYPLCLLIECKAGNKKPDVDQLSWHKEMEMLGWTVYVVRTMDEFLSVIRDKS